MHVTSFLNWKNFLWFPCDCIATYAILVTQSFICHVAISPVNCGIVTKMVTASMCNAYYFGTYLPDSDNFNQTKVELRGHANCL